MSLHISVYASLVYARRDELGWRSLFYARVGKASDMMNQTIDKHMHEISLDLEFGA